MDWQEELQPIALFSRAVTYELSPCAYDFDAGTATTFRPLCRLECRPGVERNSRVRNDDTNTGRITGELEIHRVEFREPAVIVKVCHKLFDNDAQSGELNFIKPLCFGERPRGFRTLPDRVRPLKAAGKLVRI